MSREYHEAAQKREAIVTLGRLYRDARPQIHLQTGFSDGEIPAAIEKISNGLNLLLSLCNLELRGSKFTGESKELFLESSDEFNQLKFADGGNLGLSVSEDTLHLLNNLYPEYD